VKSRSEEWKVESVERRRVERETRGGVEKVEVRSMKLEVEHNKEKY